MSQHTVRKMRIAIDGPAGAGKSTVAKALAKRLGILYVDTGAMYRAIAWLVVHHKIDVSDRAFPNLLTDNPLKFVGTESGAMEVFWREQCITDELRSPEVSNAVSELSTNPAIREILTQLQREFGRAQSVVMDGRDIGTVVLPDAEIKIFLTAELSERAQRRTNEFKEQGVEVSTEDIATAIQVRDERDANRDIAPLREAPDAHRIDSTHLTVEEVVAKIMDLVHAWPL